MTGVNQDDDWGNEAGVGTQKLLKFDSNQNYEPETKGYESKAEKDELCSGQRQQDEDIMEVMSERNKQTMRNIRLKQLQRDCPHSRDFYNLTLKIRKANHGNDSTEVKKLMQKLYPFYRWGNGNDDDDRPYRSTLTTDELATTLGRIKIFNPAAPKNLLDPDLCEKLRLGPSAAPVEPNKAKMRFIYTKIEMLYGYLLAYEETEARLSLLKYKSDFDEDVRNETLHKASQLLMNFDLLSNIVKVEKGKMVVSRLIAVVDPSVGTKVLALLVPAFAKWKLESDRKLRTVYICFSFCVYLSSEVDFGNILSAIDADAAGNMLTTELGTSFLMMILEHGQKLFEKANTNGKYRLIWADFFELVTNTVREMESVIPPIEIFPTFINRLNREGDFTSSENQKYWRELFKIFEEHGSVLSDGF